MTTTHNLGFPRIGAQRELKFALEAYWKGASSREQLQALGAQLRQRHWANQADLDLVPVGDFAFYDQVLDMSFTLGNLPERVQSFQGDALDNYFRVARGRSAQSTESHAACCGCEKVISFLLACPACGGRELGGASHPVPPGGVPVLHGFPVGGEVVAELAVFGR